MCYLQKRKKNSNCVQAFTVAFVTITSSYRCTEQDLGAQFLFVSPYVKTPGPLFAHQRSLLHLDPVRQKFGVRRKRRYNHYPHLLAATLVHGQMAFPLALYSLSPASNAQRVKSLFIVFDSMQKGICRYPLSKVRRGANMRLQCIEDTSLYEMKWYKCSSGLTNWSCT